MTLKRKKRQTFYIFDNGQYIGNEDNRTSEVLDFMAPQAGLVVVLTSLAYLVIDYLRPGTFVGKCRSRYRGSLTKHTEKAFSN